MSLFTRVAEDLVDTRGNNSLFATPAATRRAVLACRVFSGGPYGWSCKKDHSQWMGIIQSAGLHSWVASHWLRSTDPLRHDFIEYSLERATAELENSSFATNSHFLKARRNVIDNLLSLVRTNVKWLKKCVSRMLGFPNGRY